MDVIQYSNRIEYLNDKGELRFITCVSDVFTKIPNQLWLNDQNSLENECDTKQERK